MFSNSTLRQDFLASLVVFLVALPLCMGIAIASGVPPATGLLTGIVGGLVVGSIAGAPLQVTGPAAGLVVIVFKLVQDHGVAMLGPVVLLAGLFQLMAGLLRLGQWFRAITPDVIYGMLAGIGVLIFAGQFHVMLDDRPRASGIQNLFSIPEAIYKGIFPIDGSPHEMAALLGLSSIVVLVLWTAYRPAGLRFLPAALVAVVVASAIAAIGRLEVRYVDVPSTLFAAIQIPTLELLQKLASWEMIFEALGLAFVASAETQLSAVAVDRMHDGPRADYDRELVAQGVGNMVSGLLGGLPMTGVIVRSTANVQAGAKTRLSTILHGLWLLILVVLFPGVLRLIPISCLAAVLVYTGWKLMNPQHVRRLVSYGKLPLAIYLATVVGIVTTDLLKGVLLGLALSLLRLLYEMTHLKVRVERPDAERADLHLEGSATFVRLPTLAKALESVPRGVALHIHLDKLNYIDHACLELIGDWEEKNKIYGSTLVVEWEELVSRYRRPFREDTTSEARRLVSVR
ncbi:MAG: SulP family inorganic anion transporter [Bryobacteraceae bacterium]|nr:SulP family inorganic anion transporter [Bryobacteraceae bacterium]MDW8380334.1 SulP family inorganic anion transporter [Bryobacterales bacterium]